jgi:hypothetical protein
VERRYCPSNLKQLRTWDKHPDSTKVEGLVPESSKSSSPVGYVSVTVPRASGLDVRSEMANQTPIGCIYHPATPQVIAQKGKAKIFQRSIIHPDENLQVSMVLLAD